MRRAAVSATALRRSGLSSQRLLLCVQRAMSSRSNANADSPPTPPVPQFEPATSLTDIFAAGDGESPTSDVPLTQMTGYTNRGFRINGVILDGPVLLMPRTYTLWRGVSSMDSISLDSLVLTTLYAPRISLLLVGTGAVFLPPTPATRELVQQLKQRHNITVEFMRSLSAGTTFNFLNQEGRDVACALLPQ